MQKLGARFWVDTLFSLASAGLLMATLLSRGWIEEVFKVDPDKGSGALEWIIVGAALALTVASITAASREFRRSSVLLAVR